MPRLPPRLFRQAKRCSPNLATLLPACKDIPSARNELRWLREHVQATATAPSSGEVERRLAQLCQQRGRGVPLQYILGTQPFGALDIKCRPGVLIPRPETEAYVYHLARTIEKLRTPTRGEAQEPLGILDLCTGTGCIPLLLFSLLQRSADHLDILGMDISSRAVQLARENLHHNAVLGVLAKPQATQSIAFAQADIFQGSVHEALGKRQWDVLVSNPPYVSEDVWNNGRGSISHSVRKYEPRLALVPGNSLPLPKGWSRPDVFYSRLFDIAEELHTKLVLLELGDETQAHRVLSSFASHRLFSRSDVEIWRDSPDIPSQSAATVSMDIALPCGRTWQVPIRGSGKVRSLFLRVTGC